MRRHRNLLLWVLVTSLVHLGFVASDYYGLISLTSSRGYDEVKNILISFPQMIPAYTDLYSGSRHGVTLFGFAGLMLAWGMLLVPIHLGVHALIMLIRSSVLRRP